MPARPAYFHRLSEALEVFRGLPQELIDRRTLQEVLGVSKTVAWRILRQSRASQGVGSSLACRRGDLIRSLEQIQQTGRYQIEVRRRERLESHLGALLTAARSRHIKVAPEPNGGALMGTRFSALPPGIDLSPARLTIEFSGIQDFLQKLGALMFALQNDYDAICSHLEVSEAPGDSH